MRILLIYPYCLEERPQDDDVRAVPIGLYYIAALLKENNYSVEILNWYNINKTPDRIRQLLAEKKPDVIGFSILHANRWGGLEIAKIAKELDPNVTIVFGGVGATFLWKHFLTHFPDLDLVVIGEGEYTFLNLIRCLEKGELNALAMVKGLALRKGRSVIRTEDAEFIEDIDTLPIPGRYFSFQHVISARGCPWNCTFCGSPQFWKRKVRFHSPAYFVEQLAHLYRQGINFFFVSDDTFTLDSDRVIDICRRIISQGLSISWAAISRVNCVNEEMLYWMRKAGCIQISYGVESGSKRIRDFLNKKIRTKDIEYAFAITRKYGILARAYFIYGSPGETWSTIEESISLMHKIKPLGMVSYILDIYPGTALYSIFQKKTGHSDDLWLKRIEDVMFFETDSKLSADLILGFGNKLRQAFYQNLHCYIDALELVDRPDLYPQHADFCSRMGMTFSHGDFSRHEDIKEKDKIAEKLFEKALTYCPDKRAYLGLGILKQKKGDFLGSIRVLTEGVTHFPEDESLYICLGISQMNLGRFELAKGCFAKFPTSPDARRYLALCEP